MTGFEEASSVYGLFAAVNTASNGVFGGLILVTVFISLLMATLLRQNPPAESFFFASLASTITALLFLYLDLASIVWVVVFSFVLAASAVGLYRSAG